MVGSRAGSTAMQQLSPLLDRKTTRPVSTIGGRFDGGRVGDGDGGGV
jgi:hypothetical protein